MSAGGPKGDYIIKDSGQRREFSTGAVRDRGDIKPRPSLIHPYLFARFGLHMAKGAKKYSSWNWSKGMPLSDWYDSLFRHVMFAMVGDESEDHLSAICFNTMGIMVTKKGIENGIYPEELNDMPDLTPWIPLIEELIEVMKENKDNE